ncbi:MAG: phosphoesterase [Acaryochloridaceae cyanobacterium SU_2_1]|nr:phosphoesterase [Acaryochloridaceae cyanobacterium SU_2_1]NJM95692.1 phosphoesterase [Acaryochloridaceae cyanobacterium CSU_5_19]
MDFSLLSEDPFGLGEATALDFGAGTPLNSLPAQPLSEIFEPSRTGSSASLSLIDTGAVGSDPFSESFLAGINELKTGFSRDKDFANDLKNSIGEFKTSLLADLSALKQKGPDLKTQFSNIELPEGVEFGAAGQVTLQIRNHGNATFDGPVTVNLYISTDDNIDPRNDGLLTSYTSDSLRLKSGGSQSITLDYENLTSVIAHGSYHLIAEVVTPTITERNESNNITAVQVSAPGADQVLQWNAIALNAIQELGETPGQGIAPTVGSRALAIASVAVFDAVNAFSHKYQSYLVNTDAPAGASLEAAVAGAAHHVLTTLLPNQKDFFDAQLRRSLATIQDGRNAERQGVAFGRAVAQEILAARADDGSNLIGIYTPPAGDYVWQPETPGGTAVGPRWGEVSPFGISDPQDFAPDGLYGRPGTGDADRDAQYIREIEEVRLFGGQANTDLTTGLRTADQTEQAIFWASDREDTFRPYGHLNQLAETIALQEGNSIEENSRTFALLNIALADAAIVAWEAKYTELQPRPDDVISGDGRVAYAAIDGFDATVADPLWKPLFEGTLIAEGSPSFPDYISGHATFGGAFAGVLETIYGLDYAFEGVSQELINTVRSFDSFREAGLEDANSRLYGGVHVREANLDGNEAGLNIGHYVANNLLQPTFKA